MEWNNKKVAWVIVMALLSTIILLYVNYKISYEKNFDDFALKDQAVTVLDRFEGERINFLNFSMDENTTKRLMNNGKSFIFSFGNSQSHSINDYQRDRDHLFVYYLGRDFPTMNVINLSAPNANLQEMFLGIVNTWQVFGQKIEKVFVSCVFDDTREDGIRSSMHSLIDKNKHVLKQYDVGRFMLTQLDESKKNKALNEKDVLLKDKAEQVLNDFFQEHSKIYALRGNIKSNIYIQLYFLRNWIFNIKPTTKRKKIDVRYARNMKALKDIKRFCEDHKIELFFYIAPLRQDIEIPYDLKEYNTFKKDVESIYTTYNLENIVPGKYWGVINGDWVDFMHFKGIGHILLANELEKVLNQKREKNGL